MLAANKLTIHVFGSEFKVPAKYRNGYVFCTRSGFVYVSDKKPVKETFCWDLSGALFDTVGKLPRSMSEVEEAESITPIRECLVHDVRGGDTNLIEEHAK